MIVTAWLSGLAKETFNVRSNSDGRKKCDRYVYSYRYETYEWRRSMEVPVGSKPNPPSTIEAKL